MDGVAIGIPVAPRSVSRSWEHVKSLLAHTLLSIFRQTSRNFTIALACTDIPEGKVFADPRLHYIVMPAVRGESARFEGEPADKHQKFLALSEWAAKSGAKHFFPMDSDDLLSKRLLDYVLTTGTRSGFLVREGYAIDSKTGRLALLPAVSLPEVTFDRWCGSSVFATFPEGSSELERQRMVEAIWALGHGKARDRFPEVCGHAATDLPFRAVLYRLNTGENYFRRYIRRRGGRYIGSWIFRTGAFLPDQDIREEFTLGGLGRVASGQ